MQRIARDQLAVAFDRRTPPVASVRPGEIFIVETEDARGGRTRTPETTTADYLREMRRTGWFGNPVTGPIFVDGAEPGDTLAVHLQDMTVDSLGWIPIWPFLFHFEDLFAEPATLLCEIRDGFVHLDERTRVPVRPMIGCLGCTPPPETGLFSIASQYGGNMDCPDVCPGNTILFPVGVPGAAFYVGDAHAAQADGEFCGGGIEVRAEMTLTLTVRQPKPASMTWPRIETPDAIVTVAAATHLEDALNLAVRDLCYWLRDDYGYSLVDAFFVATQVADGRACQVLPNTPGPHVIRVRMPREYLVP